MFSFVFVLSHWCFDKHNWRAQQRHVQFLYGKCLHPPTHKFRIHESTLNWFCHQTHTHTNNMYNETDLRYVTCKLKIKCYMIVLLNHLQTVVHLSSKHTQIQRWISAFSHCKRTHNIPCIVQYKRGVPCVIVFWYSSSWSAISFPLFQIFNALVIHYAWTAAAPVSMSMSI